jgi:hypothetical protein
MSLSGGGKYSRTLAGRVMKQRFFVVCEGEKTEFGYFKEFAHFLRTHNVQIKAVSAQGGSCVQVVDFAILQKKKKVCDGFDQLWVVFDRDEMEHKSFIESVEKAKRAGFKVAYSNQAFELWLLMHFEAIEEPMHRKIYAKKLSFHLGFEYTKSLNSRVLFKALEPKMELALSNAQRNFKIKELNQNPYGESVTTVFECVQNLLNQLKT